MSFPSDTYFFPNNGVHLSLIGIKGKESGPSYSLGNARAKKIYQGDQRKIILQSSGQISMSQFIGRTFTAPISPAPIPDQNYPGRNLRSSGSGDFYVIWGGVRGNAGFYSAVAIVTDEEIMSLTITFFENKSPQGASSFAKNFNSEVYIVVGGTKYISSMGQHTFENLSGTTLKIHVTSNASDGGASNASLGGEWTFLLENRAFTLISTVSNAYNAG